MLLGLLTPALAQDGVDVQRRLLDGGDWVFLRESDLGVPWSPAVSGAWNVGRDLAVIEGDSGAATLLPRVSTAELAASFVVGPYARVGITTPHHGGDGVDPGWGDVSVWASFPVSNQDGEGWEGTWTFQYDVPSGREPLLAGPGALQGTLATSGDVAEGWGRWAASIGIELHRPVELPGTVWQDAWHLGAGYRLPLGPARVGAEAVARWPARILRPNPGDLPAEGAVVAGLQVHELVLVQGAAGAGVVRGLGAPSLRTVVSIDVRPREARDRDGDGVVDFQDGCRRIPEDRDGYQDGDGCPDVDNDEDGIVDASDGCPDRAENPNGIDDEDGCPESAMWMALAVTTEGPVDVVEVRLGDDAWQQAPGEAVDHVVRDLPIQPLTVWAEGHQAHADLFDGLGKDRLLVDVHLSLAPAEVVVSNGRLELPEPVFFAVDSAEVEDPGGLEPVLAWLGDHPDAVLLVEGRADASGSTDHNQDLSERRAAWVVAWLVERGAEPDRLEAVGLGEVGDEAADRRVGFRVRD